MYIRNINLNSLARDSSYDCQTNESLNVGGRTMTFAIVLGGWTVASVLLSPLIGRFLSVHGAGEWHAESQQTDRTKPRSWARPSRHADLTMRRNVAIQLDRREAGWPRAG